MAKLIDKLAQCISRMMNCQKMFVRPPGVDMKAALMCRNCREDANRMFVAYLNNGVTIHGMIDGVIVPKGFMLSRSNGMIELFARHMASVDEDEIAIWWSKNAIGPELNPKYPSVRMFLDLVVRRYADMIPVRPQGMTQGVKVEPTALASTVKVPPIPAVVEPVATAHIAAQPPKPEEPHTPAEEPEKSAEPEAHKKSAKAKRSRKSDAGTRTPEKKTDGAVVSIENEAEAQAGAAISQAEDDLKKV